MQYVIIIAGPNGAGKSTIAPELLRDELSVTEYVNADTIAQGLSAFAPENAAIAAGKVMLARLDELTQANVSFAFETTLSSRSFLPRLEKMRDKGYQFVLFYVWVSSAELSVNRVAKRVANGGHHVPEETVKRRYERGLHNFFDLYQPAADQWAFYDNSNPAKTNLIASGSAQGAQQQTIDTTLWQMLKEKYAKKK